MFLFHAYIVACRDVRFDSGPDEPFLVSFLSIFRRASFTIVPYRCIESTTETIVPIAVSLHGLGAMIRWLNDCGGLPYVGGRMPYSVLEFTLPRPPLIIPLPLSLFWFRALLKINNRILIVISPN